MSMHVRVKRKKTTIFAHVEPSHTVLEVKQKLQELIGQPPEAQRLYKVGRVLEDAKSLADLKVEDDDVLALTFNTAGVWEDIDITPFEADKAPVE